MFSWTKMVASATTTLQMKMSTFVGFLSTRKVFVECSKYYSRIDIISYYCLRYHVDILVFMIKMKLKKFT